MKRIPVLSIISIAILFSACRLGTNKPEPMPATDAPPPTEMQTATPSPISEVSLAPVFMPTGTAGVQPAPNSYGPEQYPAGINPLTGKSISDPALLERRPVSIKVNNYPRTNRPQWGLSLADIVFEYYHNNDLPRFHAIFYGFQAEMVGPIRSGRPFDNFLVKMYGSDFAFASADSRVLNRFKAAAYAERLIFLLDGKCPPDPVCRYDPQGYSFLVGSTAAINQTILDRGVPPTVPDLSGMWFSEGLPGGGASVGQAYLRYSYAAYLFWDFNPSKGNYIRMQDTQEDIQGRGEEYAELTDRLTGQRITAENVVFLIIPHFHQVYQAPSGGNPAVEIVDMDFEGDGKAYALRDGYLFEVYWVKPKNGVLYLAFSDGTRYPFKPGNTWFEVVTDETKITTSPGQIRFDFVFTPPN